MGARDEPTTRSDAANGRKARTEQAALDALAERLAAQFPELTADEITDAIRGRHAHFDDSPIRDFVPVLVERAVRADMATPASSPRHRA